MPDDPRRLLVSRMIDEGLDDDEIRETLSTYDARQTPRVNDPSRLPQRPVSAEDFMTPEQIANRDMTAMDVVKGFGKGIGRTVAGLVDTAAKARVIPGLTPESLPPQVVESFTPQYANPAQSLGGTLETVAEAVVPVVRGAQAASGAIPRLSRAKAGFESVMSAAKDVPISVSAPTNVAMRIQELASRGGSMPKPVRDWIKRVTDPSKGAEVTYQEARDFASNIGALSADETRKLAPAMRRELNELRVTLNKSIADAAGKVGKGEDYMKAMNEYARAMRLRDIGGDVVQGAKQALPYATAAGAGAWLMGKLTGR